MWHGADEDEQRAGLDPAAQRARARLQTLLRLIADFDREIDALAHEIDRRAKRDPRVDVSRPARYGGTRNRGG